MKDLFWQIQPVYGEKDACVAFAEQENLYYEPVEMYMAPALVNHAWHRELVEWYRTIGRVRSIHGAFIDVNPASASPEVREYSRNRCEESCRIAKELGAGRVVFHSSCAPFLRAAYLDNWANISAEYFMALAEKYDLTVCVENSMDVDSTPISEIMKRVSGGRVQACVDIGHVNYSNEPVEAWFDKLGENIGYMHLSDNYGSFDNHLPLGEGTVDWVLVDRLWRNLGRNIPITLEVGGIRNVMKSVDYLRQRGLFMAERTCHEL